MFVFGDFNIYRKGWLVILVELIDLELCYNFSISNDLIHLVKFPTWIPGCDLFSDASICSTMAFPPLGNFDHVVVSVSIDFQSI